MFVLLAVGLFMVTVGAVVSILKLTEDEFSLPRESLVYTVKLWLPSLQVMLVKFCPQSKLLLME